MTRPPRPEPWSGDHPVSLASLVELGKPHSEANTALPTLFPPTWPVNSGEGPLVLKAAGAQSPSRTQLSGDRTRSPHGAQEDPVPALISFPLLFLTDGGEEILGALSSPPRSGVYCPRMPRFSGGGVSVPGPQLRVRGGHACPSGRGRPIAHACVPLGGGVGQASYHPD